MCGRQSLVILGTCPQGRAARVRRWGGVESGLEQTGGVGGGRKQLGVYVDFDQPDGDCKR